MRKLPSLHGAGSFAPGTKIRTNRGEVPVEELVPGDRLLTAEGENATLRKVVSRPVRFRRRSHAGKPVVIRAGMLGGGLPERDLIVASDQRMAVADVKPRDLLARADALAPAAGLTGLPGVRLMKGRRGGRFYALVLDRPRLIYAEGCLTESRRSLVARVADRLTAGWAGALAGVVRRADGPRPLSLRQARRLSKLLRATEEVPAMSSRDRWDELMSWDLDLASEVRAAARKRSAEAAEAAEDKKTDAA